jgi:crotonobetainyl-CoA:carnitine CoA-transferase CaiB-like acyl-CoA transferase
MAIHRSPGWAKINDFAYFVKTDESAVELRDRLEYSLTDEDTIFVAKFDGVAAWRRLHDEVSDWLKENYKEDESTKRREILNSKEYWVTDWQLYLYHAALEYKATRKLSRSKFAKEVNIPIRKAAQILNGDFKGSIDEYITLLLKFGKRPCLTTSKSA